MAGLLDYLNEYANRGIDWIKSPERTQQMQMLGNGITEASNRIVEFGKRQRELDARAFGDPSSPMRVTDKEAFGDLYKGILNGPLGFAPVGMFVGVGSRTWDAASNKIAKELEKAGVSAREIWSKTGNWKAPDGNWRQEIPDNAAEFRGNFDASIASKANNYVGGSEGPIGGMYRHDELFKAYPGLLSSDRMKVTKLPDWLPDSANSGQYSRTFGGKGTLELRNKTQEGALNTAVHEMQHAVQNYEKHQGGGLEGQFKDIPGGLSAYDQYRALQGEAEARAAAARQMLTPAQRKELFPEDSYDMPISSLLSR
jgi:hypothetical protein